MRKLKEGKTPYPQTDVVTKGVPVPTEGWDAISPLADMDPKRAPTLINWVPRPGWVELRGGFTAWTQAITASGSGTPGPVETLMVLRPPAQAVGELPPLGQQRMFAATGGAIYEVTNQSQATSMASGFGSNRWQYTNFTSTGIVNVIQMVNGTDQLQMFDGTTWTTPTITGFPNGWTTRNIVNIFGGKQRLWYVMANSTICAFMTIGAIQGPIAGFQTLGTVFNKGGYLVAVCDWTIDAGEGPNSYTAFISSEGQVAVYQGIDPTNTSLWSFVGTFSMAPPVGYRCFTQYGTDIALITYQGLIPISQALPYDPSADRSEALTARIQNAMNQAVQMWGGNFGWEFITFPVETLAILNVPQSPNAVQVQYVMNTLTGAWCQFNGWNANTFALFNQDLYFGDNNGNVNWAYTGPADLVTAINADMQCAFNWFGEPGRNKHMTLIQPLLTSSGNITPTITVDVDFQTNAVSQSTQMLTSNNAWGVGKWGSMIWSQASFVTTNWQSVTAPEGKALAVRMNVNVVPAGPGGQSTFGSAVFGTAVFGGFGTQSVTLQVNAFNSVMELGGMV